MSIRNLDAVFAPRSVALVGASERPGSLGSILARNLLAGGFGGRLHFVNPKRASVHGQPTVASLRDIPLAPDLAVVVTPADAVPGVIRDAVACGTRGACVITAGFGAHSGADGAVRLQRMLDAARPGLLRIIGPNCLGVQVPALGLDASFAHLSPPPGTIAFVSQSGAIITSVLDWARPRGIGFSRVVSMGDMADVDFGDMLDWLANDSATRSILLYIEQITSARKFMSAARAAARSKPVIVVKSGRFDAGARAATTHTGALAGSDAVFDAAVRRAGMLRVHTLEDLFGAVETLSMARLPAGERLAIITNGGGIGVLAIDQLVAEGLEPATLSSATVERLSRVLPRTWSHANPIDLVGDADGRRYARALEAVLAGDEADAVLVLNCPVAVASSMEAAQAVLDAVAKRPAKPVFASFVGEHEAAAPRAALHARRVPCYQSPEDAVRAFAKIVEYRRNQALLIETVPSLPEAFEPRVDEARAPIAQALAEGCEWLSASQSQQLVGAYGVPVVATHRVPTPAAAAAAAKAIGQPVVLKILAASIQHKSDVGGVALDVEPDRVEQTAHAMLARVSAARPDASIEGFVVQPMVRRQGAVELIAGMVEDAQFGPVMLIGRGGVAVEAIPDKALGLPPLNLKLAREMIERTQVARLLKGYRSVKPADLDAVSLALVRLSQLVIDHPEIRELDVNPLLADAQGVLALDCRVRLMPTTAGSAAQRLAIRPYPKELEETLQTRDGRTLLLRPVVPEDERPLQAVFSRLTPEEVRFRFFVPMKLMDHVTAARFTQLDYDRQMALVLVQPGIPGRSEIHGVVRLIEDPDRESAEYAIIIERNVTGQGLGKLMMQRIIDYARSRGIGRIHGDVLADNVKMLGLCRSLGFTVGRVPGELGVLRVTLELREPRPADAAS